MNKPNSELVKRFFHTQKDFPSKNDLILQIQEDIKLLDIDLSEEEIKSLKKHKFKKLLKKKLYEKSFEFLFNLKNKENRSKSKQLSSYNLQNYLQTDLLTTRQKKLLFSLRTRSVDVKTNYKSMYKFNIRCRLCQKDEDSEKHYLKCEIVLRNIEPSIDLTTASYDNIFSSNIEDQVNITKIYDQIFKIRSKLLNI